MGQIKGFVDFDPTKDLVDLHGKVIFITGGTAGLGKASIAALIKHEPAHIYLSGRNATSGQRVIEDLQRSTSSTTSLTFVQLDLADLASVKKAIEKTFAHDRLDIMICNAGIMAAPPGLSKDGFEIQFATNHLGHAMLIQQLLPVMLRTAEINNSDVRIVCLTSTGWRGHPSRGVDFDQLRTTQERAVLGSWIRYGQSKLANIVYATELARRYPKILTVSVHPGVVETGLISDLPMSKKIAVMLPNYLMGVTLLKEEEGCYSQLWCAAGGKRSEMVNGAWYMPVGVMSNDKLDSTATSPELATKLWDWTQDVLTKY